MPKSHETPPYTVLRELGMAEIRDYPAYLVAETTASGTRSGAASEGFRRLAGYIFGGNAAAEKLKMTTPVAQSHQPGAPGHRRVRFMMPRGTTLDTLPRPKDATVHLCESPPRRVVVLRFSGAPTDDRLAEATEQLRGLVAGAGLRLAGGPEYLFYDSPFTDPALRRNEVAFPLA